MSVIKYKSALVLCIMAMHMYGQQTPQISHYMFNTPMYNPAAAGFTNSIQASGIWRQQWYGFEGAPQQVQIAVDAPIRAIQSGVGVNIFSDQIGIFNATTIQLAYNYQIPFMDGTLGMGVQFGMNSMGIKPDFESIEPSGNDPALRNIGNEASEFLFDVSAGFFYTVTDQYEIGISMGHLNAPKFDKVEKGEKFYVYQQRRALNLSGSYNFSLDMFPQIDFVPSTLIKSDFTTFQMDLSLIGLYDKQFWGGISYRLGDAIVLLGGLNLQQFQLPLYVGVAYDITTNRLSKGTKIGGGFEVFARYSFNISVDRVPHSYKNSRFL
ncbi:MAG: type IX secretion system membrane protein PorP/SprF [Bacteroidales bacterium]|nr:type IX secretion system membrane protein PorP/SprF [Bacteroidales bacterium]